MTPFVTRRRRSTPPPTPMPEYFAMKAKRLIAGAVEYGNRSAAEKTLMRLVIEICEEFADVGGWAQIFRDRCELRDIAIPDRIEELLKQLDLVCVTGFELLRELLEWAHGAERGE